MTEINWALTLAGSSAPPRPGTLCRLAYSTRYSPVLEVPDSAGFVVFTTREFAEVKDAALSAASRRLRSLAEKGSITRVTKGIWANTSHPHFHPLACVPYLLGKEQGYVSFLTALHLRGVLSQIPRTCQIATTGRSRTLEAAVRTFEFLQIKPELMREGIEWSDTRQPYLLATAEKALLDALYLSTRKKRRFASLPELNLEASNFRRGDFERLLKELPFPVRIRAAMKNRWSVLLAGFG